MVASFPAPAMRQARCGVFYILSNPICDLGSNLAGACEPSSSCFRCGDGSRMPGDSPEASEPAWQCPESHMAETMWTISEAQVPTQLCEIGQTTQLQG